MEGSKVPPITLPHARRGEQGLRRKQRKFEGDDSALSNHLFSIDSTRTFLFSSIPHYEASRGLRCLISVPLSPIPASILLRCRLRVFEGRTIESNVDFCAVRFSTGSGCRPRRPTLFSPLLVGKGYESSPAPPLSLMKFRMNSNSPLKGFLMFSKILPQIVMKPFALTLNSNRTSELQCKERFIGPQLEINRPLRKMRREMELSGQNSNE